MKLSTKQVVILLASILITIICQTLSAQNLQIDLIAPVKTYHFDRDPLQIDRYAKHEGGNAGLIISFTQTKHLKLNTTYSAGYIKNSFGEWSMIAVVGKSYKVNDWLRVDVNVGLASGYKEAYYKVQRVTNTLSDHSQYNKVSDVPQDDIANVQITTTEKTEMIESMEILHKLGIIPVGAISAKVNVYRSVGVIININPYYINAGLFLSI